eukprot:CAMPEP_0118953526 /NCGR_PEP_ID=MMETSP1169-20130426/56723_1 /TAXON_ID=36882 /ORGANISM="Pyramimonas obovata, Strain CCMP722" /LENGTH=77 /DNA_ID=CAMNT_0006901011 /DNA_START=71 /DNA_END=301 /DNA_ORIENTATION=+
MARLYLPMTAALDLPGSRVRSPPVSISSRLKLQKWPEVAKPSLFSQRTLRAGHRGQNLPRASLGEEDDTGEKKRGRR